MACGILTIHRLESTAHAIARAAAGRGPYSAGMHPVGVVALLLYTLGAYAYGAVLALSIQDYGRRGWAAQSRNRPQEAELVGGAMMLLGTIWFLANIVLTIVQLGPPAKEWTYQIVVLWLAFCWPPMIMHVTLAEIEGSHGRSDRTRAWRWMVRFAYPLILLIPLWATAVFVGLLTASGRTIDLVLNAGLTIAFVAASIFSVTISKRAGDAGRTPRKRLGDRAMDIMFIVTVIIFLLMPVLALSANVSFGAAVGKTLEIGARTLPLGFLFVGTYFQSRFEFFDIVVKRGLTLLASLAVLTLFFAAARPLLVRFRDLPAAHWVYAVLALPVVLVLPWMHARISSALDRRWLGRRFSTVDAVKHVVATLRTATTEPQLVTLAEQALGEIFGAPAKVVWLSPPLSAVALAKAEGGSEGDPPFDVKHTAAFRCASGEGRILMGPRDSEAPYFSQDVALLGSLADVTASALDNLHLQARKQEQEQLAHELSLHASRSELKALRAQINPHFLFNALNAIAGLIPRNPDRADRTIEQLADVFRYALRGAESEWAVLDDEVEFVRSYLEVERARFGERLQVTVDVAPEARGARVPTMVLQTLVENAVKHGLSEVIGQAQIGVDARVNGDRLVMTVTDNGEGFKAKRQTSNSKLQKREGGYGLANIRQRLEGYFGDKGVLTMGRDEGRALTVVSVTLPLLREIPGTLR
jgi:GNAT superfamily N-acetyltransferase